MAKFLSLDNLTRWAGVMKIGFSSTTAKTTLVDADTFLIMDSADTETVNSVSNVKKRKAITWANFKVELGNFFAAADAMVFKGTLGSGGTVTSLPTTHQVGWTYRVITAGTYAGNVCEIGDLIIALIDRAGSGNQNTDWTVAQANADLSGIPLAADTNPVMDGTVTIGVSTKYARQDHVHPSDTAKLGTAGDGSSVTAAFTVAGAKADVASGDTLAVLFGKLKKWYADFGAAAWAGIGTGSTQVAAGDHTHGGYAASSHAHGNITNAGAIGSTIDLPIITDTSGVLIAGAWASNAEIDAIVV